jgi:hypothetical protein
MINFKNDSCFALIERCAWLKEILMQKGSWFIILWIIFTLTAFITAWEVRGNYCSAI